MTFFRLIRRSLQNKSPKLGSEGSNYHALLRQQLQHLGLNHRKTLLIPSYTTLYNKRQHFHSTSTTSNQLDGTVLFSESPELDIKDATEIDETDFWKNATGRIDIEGRTADDVWEEYIRLLEDPTIQLTEFDYASVCVALKKDKTSPTSIKRMQALLRQIHERGDMPKTFLRCCNMLIYLYLEHQDLDSAKLVFDGLLRSKYKPTAVTVNTLLNGISQLGTAKDALALHQSLSRQGLFPDSLETYQTLIKVVGVYFGDVNASMAIFNRLLENSKSDDDTKNKDLPTPDITLYNTVLHIYRLSKQPERAWAFYQQQMMADGSNVTPTIGTYYTLLTTLKSMKDGDNKATWTEMAYNDMQRLGLEIRASHYQAMGWEASNILNILEKNGSKLTVYDFNLLLANAVKNNKFEEALEMFQHMTGNSGDGLDKKARNQCSPDVFSYGIIMDALVKDIQQPVNVVFDMYEEMKLHGVAPDVVIFCLLIQACARDGNIDHAMSYLKEMQQFNIRPNTYILTSFMGVLSQKPVKEKDDMYKARALWDEMLDGGIHPNTRAFNHYLSLLSQFVPTVTPNEIKSARSLMRQDDDDRQQQQQRQQQLGDLFDDYGNRDDNNTSGGRTPISGTAKYMMNLYRTMHHSKNKFSHPDFLTYSIMINTMVAQGQTRQAMLLFRDAQMSRKSIGVNIYNTVMQGLLQDNDLHQVLHMWQDMKANRVLPDRVTYDLVLDACEQLHLAESFTVIMKQRDADQVRLARLDENREKRWSRSKSFKEHKKRQQRYLGDDGFD